MPLPLNQQSEYIQDSFLPSDVKLNADVLVENPLYLEMLAFRMTVQSLSLFTVNRHVTNGEIQ